LAISIHDIRRINDKKDSGHGKRAAIWLQNNVGLVLSEYNIDSTTLNIGKLLYAIEFHETPDFQIPKAGDEHNTLLKYLKLVDAMDRFRLPSLKWWLDNKHLSLTAPDEIIMFAFKLVLESESYFLYNKFSFAKLIELSINLRNEGIS
jgi:hypothetical protein